MSTICVGMAARHGLLPAGGGEKGKRHALPNSEILVHQPSYGVNGQATDIKIHTDWLLRTKDKLLGAQQV